MNETPYTRWAVFISDRVYLLDDAVNIINTEMPVMVDRDKVYLNSSLFNPDVLSVQMTYYKTLPRVEA